jgi:hypothetical protein
MCACFWDLGCLWIMNDIKAAREQREGRKSIAEANVGKTNIQALP